MSKLRKEEELKMGVFKCKMCGANLNVSPGQKICECEYCGSKQTIVSSDDETLQKSVARGNKLRSEYEFDKAYSLFESALKDNDKNAELYWNLLLCKYGITYVDDYDGKKKPTINRYSNISILDDEDYNRVLEYTDAVSKKLYIEQTNEINAIQAGIQEIISKEEPYDIFISYKETDEFGDRTEDSVLAQDIYSSLEKEGYRVFLSRLTLSQVAGQEYEPFIYSALYTSKMMILVTTSEDYVNSVWVRNEWSRFLDMIKKNNNKKLIPCYKNIDPYDLPKELRNIQGLDMSKLGFIQDLIAGVNKILNNKASGDDHRGKGSLENVIKRGDILIEDGIFDEAQDLANKTLIDYPECAELYEILLLSSLQTDYDKLISNPVNLITFPAYKRMIEFGGSKFEEKYKKVLSKYEEKEKIKQAKIEEEKRKQQEEQKKKNERIAYLKQIYVIKNDIINSLKNIKLSLDTGSEIKKILDTKVEKLNNYKKDFNDYKIYKNEFGDHSNCNIETDINNILSDNFDLSLWRMDSRDGLGRLESDGVVFIRYKFLSNELIINIDNSEKEYSSNKYHINFHIEYLTHYIDLAKNGIPSMEKWGYISRSVIIIKITDKISKNLVYNCYGMFEGMLRPSFTADQEVEKHKENISKFYLYSRMFDELIDDFDYDVAKGSKSLLPNNYPLTEDHISEDGGCYVATCVYGNYDCPEVWRLRRYRDFYLDEHWWGRLFIKCYYAVSPTLVRWFGKKEWFRKPAKKLVDKKISRATEMGFSDAPYNDKY